MNLYKLIVVILCVPITSIGQCVILEISTNGDWYSSYQNTVSISSNGILVDSWDMWLTDWSESYCLDPGDYLVEISDDAGNGIYCGNSYSNFINISLDNSEIFNLDCLSWPYLNSDWDNQSVNVNVPDPLISGCTDEFANNYNINASVDDGSCEYPSIGCTDPTFIEFWYHNEISPGLYEIDLNNFPNYEQGDESLCLNEMNSGCTDQNACNYDSLKNVNDGTCEYPDNFYDCYGACLSDIDDDGTCDELELSGCTDSVACNYEPNAEFDDSTCEYAPAGYNCYGNELISGCTNFLYAEYYDHTIDNFGVITLDTPIDASEDDGSCITPLVWGCTDQNYFEYDPNANTSNSPDCINLLGCTDSTYLNYDPEASVDNGSCNILAVPGCTNIIYLEFDTLANQDDGSCETLKVNGCTDPLACNHNPEANTDNGSCEYAEAGLNCDGTEIIEGCTDYTFLEYYLNYTEDSLGVYTIDYSSFVNAQEDDGSCNTALVWGCSDQNYLEYSDTVNVASMNASDCINLKGCMDSNACNYNADADVDDNSCTFPEPHYDCDGVCLIDTDGDGVCDELEIMGCQDSLACNFNIAATDSADCDIPVGCDSCSGSTDGSGSIINNDADSDGVCDTDEVIGCMNSIACNYNPNATDAGACSFPDAGSDCNGECISDADGDGICDEFEIVGCIDVNASNYEPLATDAGDCEYPGCTDTAAFNYDENANIDDGSCEAVVEGCTNISACNYNLEANTTVNDLCVFALDISVCAECSGETDGTGTVIENDADGDGICDSDETNGCTDPFACNYNPNATDDDGSCDTSSCYGCVDADACNFNANAFYPSQNCVFASDVSDCAGCSGETDGTGTVVENDADSDGICDSDELSGCMDSLACNYNPNVTDDDGSCDTSSCLGCIDSNACNYIPEATISDESCIFPEIYYNCDGTCSEDDDNDGICNELEITGCPDVNACNYNPNSTDEEECNFALAYYDCDENCLNDSNGNLICDELEVDGCTDTDACNYNSNANVNDGSCEFPENYYNCDGTCSEDDDNDGICNELEIIGCPDVNACNYNPNSTDEGECNFALEYYDCDENCLNDSNGNLICDELEVDGCTDTDACNYNSNANVDDGSCEFAEEFYDCSGNCLNDTDLNGICDELEITGCTDLEACNYNASASIDDGSCEYIEVTLEFNNTLLLLEASSSASAPTYQWNVNGQNVNINSDRLSPFVNGLYTLSVYDEENDCWGDASYNVNNVFIHEIESDIIIFPNPVHNTLQINSKLNNQNTTIEVYNYLGDLCDAFHNMNPKHAQFDVSKLPSGIYILKLTSDEFILQKEFIKY